MVLTEILVQVMIMFIAGAILGTGASQVLAEYYLELKRFGVRWTLLVTAGAVAVAYVFPLTYIWVLRNPYFDDLIADFSLQLHEMALIIIAFLFLNSLVYNVAKSKDISSEK